MMWCYRRCTSRLNVSVCVWKGGECYAGCVIAMYARAEYRADEWHVADRLGAIGIGDLY